MKKSAGFLAVTVLAVLALGRSLSPSPAHSTAGSALLPAGATPESAALAATRDDDSDPFPPADPLLPRVVYSKKSTFIWPASGSLTSYFGPGHPLGIDIALDPGSDTPVRAAGSGIVTFAGGNTCCSYGLYVEIDHDNGLSTLYGHFSKLLVSEGETVEQGQVLGLGGATGDADGKHVHFEVRDGDGVLDPLRFLPARQSSTDGGAAACPEEPVRADSGSSLLLDFTALVPGGSVAQDAVIEEQSGGYPLLEAGVQTPLDIWLAVPVAPAATGKLYRFGLNVTFQDGDVTQTVACQVIVSTMATQANSPATIAGYRAKFLTATATPWPTRTPRPTNTPVPARPTATSKPPINSENQPKKPTPPVLGPTKVPTARR